jgi:carbon monoxide dehydrogenase subunit G
MIDTDETIAIRADIDSVWAIVRNIRNWASLMPGMQDCEVLDADNSRWTLKVGVGALVRTVKVKVHVHQWDGPRNVSFSFRLEGDPVQGSGSYRATAGTSGQTDVLLRLRVEGSGPMAPMWEAMSRPLLPQLAKAFAGKLKERIEIAAESMSSEPALPPQRLPWIASLSGWFRTLRRAILARAHGKSNDEAAS